MERNGAQAPRQPCSELFLSAVYRLKQVFLCSSFGNKTERGWDEETESKMGIHTEFEYNEMKNLDLFILHYLAPSLESFLSLFIENLCNKDWCILHVKRLT